MTDAANASVHASAVLVGNCAVLIRGPSGAGKSRLAFDLILAGRAGQIAPAVLIGDDRVHLETRQDRIIVRPARELAGLIEIRGLGIRRCDFAEQAIVGLVVDLNAADAERLPPPEALVTRLHGVNLPRIPVEAGYSALPLIVAELTTTPGYAHTQPSSSCAKGIGNHISPTLATE
ncbi:HPr kinase/phosphatase C-terminal domain-containing protein [Bradyrhizobium sp. dw_411]|uniref:HPr kinase/phosphorylase n=1 Tax=Bradyrhizobium sp. dw_411 TaxID=2720082 RepID=UPI001BCE3DAE|nr:HPr kinase/phosphatase C-terminal domain-containing protein [Bradyrhizobium sp. dw_411]